MSKTSLIFLIFYICLSTAIVAAPISVKQDKNPGEAPQEKKVVTHHSAVIGGRNIPYTATAGTLILRDKEEKPIAEAFYVAYLVSGESSEKRPVTFVYNGGPGASSVFLHLGGVGPRRVLMGDGEFTAPPPYPIVDNSYSILDKTDLVFIDPVGTGYSRPLGKSDYKMFWGVDQDVSSVGQMIRLYVTENHRWNSPKFLLGESYGTTRSAALVDYLQNEGIQCNGVMLLSSILNFETESFALGNDLPYILYLPSYAATAWYHHRLSNLPKHLPDLLAQVEKFATGEYESALMKGKNLSAQDEDSVAGKLSKYTGIGKDFWKRANLRVNNDEFEKLLLDKKGKLTGRLDTRYTGYQMERVLPFATYSAEWAATSGPFTAAMNSYLHDELNYSSKRDYEIVNGKAGSKWDWKHQYGESVYEPDSFPGFLNVAPDLKGAMVTNPYLQVMVNNGYFDLGTPYYATNYTFDHLDLPKQLEDHVHIYNYYSGHMIYIHTPSLRELHDNMGRFIEGALTVSPGAAGHP